MASYKAHGVGSLHDLAGLDWRTAELVRGKVDVEGLLSKAAGRPGTTQLADVIANRPKQVQCWRRSVCTRWPTWKRSMRGRWRCARPVRRTRPVRSSWPGPVSARHRHTASAASMWSPCPGPTSRSMWTWRTPTTAATSGAHSSPTVARLRRNLGTSGSPRGIPTSRSASSSAFEEFWSWLTEERARAAAEGATFRAYCYSRSAEQGQMRRLADRIGRGRRDEVDEFFASDEWVDLLEVVRDQLITGRSMGLKETAPLAGFAWRSDDGGGTLAIVKYEQATDEEAGPVRVPWRRSGSSSTTRMTSGRRRRCASGSTGRRGISRRLRSRRAELSRRSSDRSPRGPGAPWPRGSACSRRCASAPLRASRRPQEDRRQGQAEQHAGGRQDECQLVARSQGVDRRLAISQQRVGASWWRSS